MMATRTIDLTDALDRFVAEQIEAGVYQNASEAVRAGLQLLKAEEEARAAKLERFKAAIQEGIDDVEAGRVIDVDDIGAYFDEIEAEILARLPNTQLNEAVACVSRRERGCTPDPRGFTRFLRG